MSLIEYTLFGKVDKVKSAIERIRLAEMSQEPLYVCYSGGKDSKVIRRLCEMAGVNYELHYNLTSVDHPSVVREILDDKEVIVDIPRDENGKQITMWSLIVQKEAYIRAFEKMLKVNSNVSYSWKSGEEVFEWWMNRSGNLKKEKGQISFLGAQNE